MGATPTDQATSQQSPGQAQTGTSDAYVEVLKAYAENFKILVEGKRIASKSYDQAMLALSGGALGLSVTFVDKFVPQGKTPKLEGWLLASWLLFALALTLTLTSFLTSHEAYRIDMDRANKAVKNRQQMEGTNRLSIVTYWLNRLALCAFAAGVPCLIAFVWLNLVM